MWLGRHVWLVVGIFLAALMLRVSIAYSSEGFSYDGYYGVGKVLSIREAFPFPGQDLSYSPAPFMPLFYYLLAALSFFLPAHVVLKFVPNLLASLSVFAAYLVCFEVTRDRGAAVFSALSVAFVPVFVFRTVNSVSPYSLAVPLMLFLAYLFLVVARRRFVGLFVVVLFALVLAHPSALVVVLGFAFFVVLMYALGARVSRASLEIVLFSLAVSFWAVFIFFKEPLAAHGFSLLWQNLPQGILAERFVSFDVVGAIYGIGLLTFAAGIFVVYRHVFSARDVKVHVLIALSIVSLALLLFGMVEFFSGLMLLGVFFVVMSGEAFKHFFGYIQRTYLSRRAGMVVASALVLLTLTSVVPSALYRQSAFFDEPSARVVSAFGWLGNNSRSDAVVFSDIDEGFLVSSVSQRRNFLDESFLTARDAESRLRDMEVIYTTSSEIAALEAFEKYGITHMVVTERSLSRRNLSGLRYLSEACFSPVFRNSEVSVYEVACRVRT